MKRIAIAGAGIFLTLGLAIFAVAVAQRDSREREHVLSKVVPDYARQEPAPITFPIAVENSPTFVENFPVAAETPIESPANYLRNIAETIPPRMMEEVGSIAPLDSASPLRWPDEESTSAFPLDRTQTILAGHESPANQGQPTNPANSLTDNQENPATMPSSGSLVPPPGLLAPPTDGAIPRLPNATLSSPADGKPGPSVPTLAVPTLATPAPTRPKISAPTSSSIPSSSPPPNFPSGPFPSSSIPRTEKPAFGATSSAPGARQMDGAQNPSLQIHKRAPEEVQVGQPATFPIIVRNVGNATAYDVSVVDSVPRGTRLSKTNPTAESRSDGTLVWSLGEMAAGSEQVLSVELIPETEGEIGSVASVNFAAQASVRTVSTQPKLSIKQVAENKILLGQPIKIRVTVANEGTGVARGVSLEEDVPDGLRHPSGNFLGAPFGDLVPGQSRTIDLELMSVKPGPVRNQIRAVSANTSEGNSTLDIEVVTPQLQVSIAGPGLRYLERQATYQVSVTNRGTAMAYDVMMTAKLPRGFRYNTAGDLGEYRADQHAVHWKLDELNVGGTATTELTLLPVEEGEFAIRVQSEAIGVQSEPIEKQIRIEGQSELAFSIEDDNDPIEVNGQTNYVVQVTNTGTRVDEDVQVMVELPKGAKVLEVHGPVGYKETPQGLVFDAIPQMRAKDQHLFRFSARLSQDGVHVVRAHVKSKLRPIAVVKEESTEVYRDQ